MYVAIYCMIVLASCYALTWNNGFAECVEFKSKINQSVNVSVSKSYVECHITNL